MKKNFFLITFLLLVFLGCGQNEKEISVIKESQQNLEIVTAYNEAYKALEEGDPYFAAKKFLEAELLLPQSEWAPKSALMASYSFYLQNYYAEALSNLERFLKTYPNNKDEAYVHYLIDNPFSKHVFKKILDLITLLLKYFFGNNTDSSTLIKAARCIKKSYFEFFKIILIFFVLAISYL